jgi:hypothetical protein
MTMHNEKNESRLSTADFANAGAANAGAGNVDATTDMRDTDDRGIVTSDDRGVAMSDDRGVARAGRAPVDRQTTPDAAPVERQSMDRSDADRREALFPGTEAETFQSRWSEIQVSFVDEPRQSVEHADALVAEVMQRLARVFSDERSRLEQQWDRGEDTDTEALRYVLRRYRSFFDRLLSL